MNQKDYFQQLRDELHGHPFENRFLEELQNHAEDLEEEGIDIEDWEKIMGKPKEVREDFIKITSPWNRLKFYVEALLWAMLALPLMTLFAGSLGAFIDEYALDLWDHLLQLFIYSLFLILFSTGISLRYQKIKSHFLQSRKAWYLTIFLPSLFPTIPRFAYIDQLPIEAFLMIIGMLVLLVGLSFLGYRISKAIHQDKANTSKKWFYLIKTFIFAYFLAFLIYRTSQTYQTIVPPTDNWQGILAPLIFFEGFLRFFGQILLSMILPDWPNLKLLSLVYLPGVFICGLAIVSIVNIIKNKKITLLKLIFISYCISIFLIRPDLYEGKLDFKVPTLNLSKIIEEHQAMIFYTPMKYFNRDESSLFHYKVSFDDNQFKLENNDRRVYWLDPSKLNDSFLEANYKDLISRTETQRQVFELEKIQWPEGFECVSEIDSAEFPGEEPRYCNRIFYNQKLILDAPVAVADIAISSDKKWGIFIEERTYDPSNVYLLQLPQS